MKTQNLYFKFLFVVLFFVAGSTYAQTNSSGQPTHASASVVPPPSVQGGIIPNAFNYQAVARNSSGNILANQTVGIRISIENGSGGPVLYSERQVPTTNQFGLFTLKIGNGTVLSGVYNSIVWANGSQWLKVDMDPAGGTSYTTMGESELLSVPFSNFSSTTGAVSGTTSTMAQFTGPNTVGNSSAMFDNGFGYIGAGTNAPSYYPLSLYNANDPVIGFNNAVTTNSGGHGTMLGLLNGDADFYIWNWENASVVVRTNGVDQMTVTGAGNVGIGTTTPAAKLDVAGNAHITDEPLTVNTSGDLAFSIDGGAAASFIPGIGLYQSSQPAGYGVGLFGVSYANAGGLNVGDGVGLGWAPVQASAFNVSSDRRMKKNITDITSSDYSKYMSQIRSIESSTFFYKWETADSRPFAHIGVIAQTLPGEVQAHLSESPSKRGEERLGVSLADLSGLLLVGVKALDEKQTKYESEIASLKAQIEELKTQINQMKK